MRDSTTPSHLLAGKVNSTKFAPSQGLPNFKVIQAPLLPGGGRVRCGGRVKGILGRIGAGGGR